MLLSMPMHNPKYHASSWRCNCVARFLGFKPGLTRPYIYCTSSRWGVVFFAFVVIFVSSLMTVGSSIILGLHKRVGNLFTAVDRADENKESTSNNYEAKGSSGVVAFVVSNNLVYII